LVLLQSRLGKTVALANLLLFARALLFSGSRGSYVAVLFSVSILGIGFLLWFGSRRKAVRLAVLAAAGLLLLILAKPDLAQRPNVRRFLTISKPMEQGTFRWRMTHRWPHFFELAREHPWLGTGSSYDSSLGPVGGSPHNGYLALAVDRGFPFLAITLFMGISAIHSGLASFLRARDASSKALGLIFAAFIAGLFVHNIVESTLPLPFISRIYWMAVGLSLALVQPWFGKHPSDA